MAKIYIDAGHGGTDHGASANGLREKDITLKIANFTRDYLRENYNNISIKMSRTGDTTKSLQARTNEANGWNADAYVSIHVNAGGGTGFESYVYPGVGSRTKQLQDFIHDEVMDVLGNFRNRGLKEANFHVLRETQMDAVLTENLFIDTASDADFLRNNNNLKKLGEAHAEGIAQFFGLSKNTGNQQSQTNETNDSNQNQSSSGRKGRLQIVNVKHSAIVMDRPDRNNAARIGTLTRGKVVPLNGSVRGKNSPTGYWEIRYKGRLGYITGKFGRRI